MELLSTNPEATRAGVFTAYDGGYIRATASASGKLAGIMCWRCGGLTKPYTAISAPCATNGRSLHELRLDDRLCAAKLRKPKIVEMEN